MIEQDDAEKSLEFLRTAAMKIEGLVLDAKAKARKAKYVHALAIVRLDNANTPHKVPATVRKEHALTDPEVQQALKEADEADAKLISHNAQCDAAKERIMLFKAQVRDRM
jgi:hypothetical protein